MPALQYELSEPEKRYLEDLSREAGPQHPLQHILKETLDLEYSAYCIYTSKGCCSNGASTVQAMLETLEILRTDTVCVIERISAKWIVTLGVEWALDQGLFLDYALGKKDSSLWEEVMGGGADG